MLQQPSYASIFPLGQGIALALGRAIFGHPWAGVLLEEAALCALCYWMLRGWIPAGWALAGGILAVFQLGPLTYWMNSYWGGAVSGIAGCLVFGALSGGFYLLRHGRGSETLTLTLNRGGSADARTLRILLGMGLSGLELLTRPVANAYSWPRSPGFFCCSTGSAWRSRRHWSSPPRCPRFH